MRAAVYKGEQVLQVEELPDPTPGPNQVVMRVKYSAICGTDVHAFMYDLAQPGAGWAMNTPESSLTLARTSAAGASATAWWAVSIEVKQGIRCSAAARRM